MLSRAPRLDARTVTAPGPEDGQAEKQVRASLFIYVFKREER